MTDRSTIEQAGLVARKFIERQKKADPDWAGIEIDDDRTREPVVFWWHGEIPLVEIPLRRQGMASGSVLVSSDRRLPPVLQYATSGPPFSAFALETLAQALNAAGTDAKPDRYVFFTSTELWAEVESGGRRFMINLPTLQIVEQPEPLRTGTTPESVFDQNIVRDQWDTLSGEKPRSGPPKVVLSAAKPVRFSQNCESYSRDGCKLSFESSPPSSACSPAAISGCAPVAWAVLLSGWKRYNMENSNRIWPGSTCWSNDWNTPLSPNPSSCRDVEMTVWELHRLMGTSADGGTFNNRIIDGAKIFGEFGLGWRFSQWQNASFDQASSLIEPYKQPFVWGAQGTWPPAPIRKVGHAVYVYGYDRSNRTVYICLGWGSGYSDVWASYDQYSDTVCAFVATFKGELTGAADEPVRVGA